MRYLSVCSGIEAASVAWEPLGWSPVGFSEIDPFASAVLAGLASVSRRSSHPIRLDNRSSR